MRGIREKPLPPNAAMIERDARIARVLGSDFRWRDQSGRFKPAPRMPDTLSELEQRDAQALPIAPIDPVRNPSHEHPRWRLRVFDRKWPWRASRVEAQRDATEPWMTHYDEATGTVYVDAVVDVQRDPPLPGRNPYRPRGAMMASFTGR